MTKVFLKFNRKGEIEEKCLSFWLKLFAHYSNYFGRDLFSINQENIPINLKIDKSFKMFSNNSLIEWKIPKIKISKMTFL